MKHTQASALALAVALGAFAHHAQASNSLGDSDVVLWMLDNVPYVRVMEGPGITPHEGINLYPNPGQWTLLAGPPDAPPFTRVTSWTAIGDADGYGTTVVPPDHGNLYYQRYLEYHALTFGTRRDYYAFVPTYDQSQTIANIANGLVIGDTDKHNPLHVEGHAFKAGNGEWDYRYLFTNTGQSSSTFEFMLSEADAHHLHDEVKFLNANGNYRYDGPPISASLDLHNYDWTHLSLLPGDSLMVGFSDIHGPTLENWGVKLADGTVSMGTGLLPVPAPVPEPESLALALVGLMVVQLNRFARYARGHAASPRSEQTLQR